MGFITNLLRALMSADPGRTEFLQGKHAHMTGTPRSANPYLSGLTRALWFKGWEHGAEVESAYYLEGWNASLAGQGKEENPYPPESGEARAWVQGWEDFDAWASQQF